MTFGISVRGHQLRVLAIALNIVPTSLCENNTYPSAYMEEKTGGVRSDANPKFTLYISGYDSFMVFINMYM